MSKVEHVQAALHGRDGIASWRKAHPGENLDFTQASMSSFGLNRADLSGADFSAADLVGVHMNLANLHGACLRGAIPVMAEMRGADLSQADLGGANLDRAILPKAKLAGSNLSRANLADADLRGADLSGAGLAGATLAGADLEDADLGGANLSGVNLSHANLSGANLSGANLGKAILNRTRLAGTVLEGASFFRTVIGDCDLSAAVGLDSVIHEGPSVVGADTLQRSAGRVSRKFLRLAGVPEATIAGTAAPDGGTGTHFTCFITCAIQDEVFARKLHDDLQARGVRCWYFPADTRGGLWIMDDVDRGIRYYDRLLAVCSTESLAAERFREEIAHGIRKQAETGRWVLFPVVISDSATERGNRYVRSMGLLRHVSFDFRRWRESRAYSRALDKLVKALSVDRNMSAGMVRTNEA